LTGEYPFVRSLFDVLPPTYNNFGEFRKDVDMIPSVWAHLESKKEALGIPDFSVVITNAIERHDEEKENATHPDVCAAIPDEETDNLLEIVMRLVATHPSKIFDTSFIVKEDNQFLAPNCLTYLWLAAHHCLGNAIESTAEHWKAARTIRSFVMFHVHQKINIRVKENFSTMSEAAKKFTADLTEQFRKEPCEFGKCVFAVLLDVAIFKKSHLDFSVPWTEEELKKWKWTDDFPPLSDLTRYEHHLLDRHWAMHEAINPFSSLKSGEDSTLAKQIMSQRKPRKGETLTPLQRVQEAGTGPSTLVRPLGNIRAFKSKLTRGCELFLVMRHMYQTESKQMVYSRVTAEFKLHPKTAKPMTSTEIIEHQATVIKVWDDAMRRMLIEVITTKPS